MELLFQQKKKFSTNFSKAQARFCQSFHYHGNDSYFLVNEKEIFRFKVNNENINLPTWFCLGSIPDRRFDATEFRQVSLRENVYDFSVGYNAIDKPDILKIHK